jgi:hypothetical protein
MVSKRNWDVGQLVMVRLAYEFGGARYVCRITEKNKLAEMLYCSREPNTQMSLGSYRRIVSIGQGQVFDITRKLTTLPAVAVVQVTPLRGSAKEKAGRTSFVRRV